MNLNVKNKRLLQQNYLQGIWWGGLLSEGSLGLFLWDLRAARPGLPGEPERTVRCLQWYQQCSGSHRPPPSHYCGPGKVIIDGWLVEAMFLWQIDLSNDVDSFDSVSFLFLSPKLHTVTFRGNPIASQPDYKERMTRYLPRLKALDPAPRKFK